MNKKGTPLYSREDIREQYCINDKELQVLDRSQRKSLLGCFSNQGQVSRTRPNLRPQDSSFPSHLTSRFFSDSPCVDPSKNIGL